jgi:hypothetical protein
MVKFNKYGFKIIIICLLLCFDCFTDEVIKLTESQSKIVEKEMCKGITNAIADQNISNIFLLPATIQKENRVIQIKSNSIFTDSESIYQIKNCELNIFTNKFKMLKIQSKLRKSGFMPYNVKEIYYLNNKIELDTSSTLAKDSVNISALIDSIMDSKYNNTQEKCESTGYLINDISVRFIDSHISIKYGKLILQNAKFIVIRKLPTKIN